MIKLLKIAIQKSLLRIFDLQLGCLIAKKKEYIIIFIATYLSYSNSIGHTCLPISIFEKKKFFPKKEKILIKKILNKIKNIKNWKKELLKYHSVSDGKINTPLIIDNNQLYLNRNWNIEKKIFNFIKNNNKKSTYFIKYVKKINQILLNIKEKQQRIAICLAIINKISFIIGGPGTGKTTIIKNIIDIILKISKKKLNIKITAYTGKATYRITEILKNNIHHNNIIKYNIQITTLHKLIGIKKYSQDVYFNVNNLLPADIIIIDESSMIDLFTINKLINALSKKTQVIFLGDINQLPPIETGSILKNICCNANNKYNIKKKKLIQKITACKIDSNNNTDTNINNCIYILKKNHRFKNQSNINIFSKSILKNDINIINKVFNNEFNNIKYNTLKNQTEYNYMMNEIIIQYQKYWNTILKKKSQTKIITSFNYFKILCTVYHGPFGVHQINKNIENTIIIKNNIKKHYINHDYWYHGRPIIIKKNNKILKLCNGDIGIAMYNKEKKIELFFLSFNNTIKKIPINLLNQKEYEVAWSTTIHKSQGSEFLNTIIILPNTFIKILTKELLYTAVTRSKKNISIFSDKNIFIKTCKNNFIRYNGIRNMIIKEKN